MLVFGLLVFVIQCQAAVAQNNRASESNQIGWHAFFLNYAIAKKWSFHGEVQLRRVSFIDDAQQNLYRMGINYSLHPQVTFRTGYAFADTYNYGVVPIQANGIRFPEHRTYQMVLLKNPIEKVDISHRLMLEQRWVGRSLDPKAIKADELVYFNRIRYMFRMDIPFQALTRVKKTPYLSFYDEIMIGFGRNVNQNIFDQNRIGALAGMKFNQKMKIEAGYLNQLLQLGRFVDGKNHFQHNSGYVINSYFNF